MELAIKIIESGNDLNGVGYGDKVYDAKSGTLLRLTTSPGSIQTGHSRGNYRVAKAEPTGDVTDLTDAEFEALPQAEIEREQIVELPSKDYEDYDDEDGILAHAAAKYAATRPALRGWDLSPRFADDNRETIALTIPAHVAVVER